MKFSIVIVSHDKPFLLPEAIASLLLQTHQNWVAYLLDSGVLWDKGYFDTLRHWQDPRLMITRHETPPDHPCPASYCFNQMIPRLMPADLVVYLNDDDVLYPNALTTFNKFFSTNQAACAYASQDLVEIDQSGNRKLAGDRSAVEMAGAWCRGLDPVDRIDYLQFCHRPEVFNHVKWPETADHARHADGIFMRWCGERWPIHPINTKVSCNRRTWQSRNKPL